jgi:hypothetical protein
MEREYFEERMSDTESYQDFVDRKNEELEQFKMDSQESDYRQRIQLFDRLQEQRYELHNCKY